MLLRRWLFWPKGQGVRIRRLRNCSRLYFSRRPHRSTWRRPPISLARLSEFGLKAADSTHVVDLLAKTAATTKTDLGEMSAAFGKVAPDAKAAGVSIEQTAALFGALSDQGIRGKKATSDLTAIFQEMANPTSKLREQLLALGLSGDSLSTVLHKLSGNSAETQRIVEALGTKGGSAFRALVSAAPDVERLNKILGESGGAAQSAADKFDRELGGAFTNFKNSFIDATKALAEPLLKPLAEHLRLCGRFASLDETQRVAGRQAQAVSGKAEGAQHGLARQTSGLAHHQRTLRNGATALTDFGWLVE